jgi:hypothetical protein
VHGLGAVFDNLSLNTAKIVTILHLFRLYIHAYIPWIHKFVMATTGCGISHKDTKHADKFSNNKKQHRNNTTKPQTDTFSKYCNDNIQKVWHKVYTYFTRFIKQTAGKKKTFAHIMSHF